MNKICTTVEQSKKLIELGIDVNTADMSYCPVMDIDSRKNNSYLEVPECYSFSKVKDFLVPYLPAWSLAALLGILPKGKILIDDVHSNKYKVIGYNLDTDYYDEPLDACVAMIEKLHEQKLL